VCVCFTAEMYRIRAEGETSTSLHSTRPLPVQDLVVRYVTGLRIRHLHSHHYQHPHAGYEGLSRNLFSSFLLNSFAVATPGSFIWRLYNRLLTSAPNGVQAPGAMPR